MIWSIHRDDVVILVRVEGAQRVSRGGVRSLEKSKKRPVGRAGKNTASHEQALTLHAVA